MQYRKMGSLDWEVSALGFGCMRLPSRRFNRMRADTDESIRIIRHGIDQGINYIDTAWPYHLGDSERIVGQALAGWLSRAGAPGHQAVHACGPENRGF